MGLNRRLGTVLCLTIAASALSLRPAQAQRRHGGGGRVGRPAVVVGGFSPFYDPFVWSAHSGWYPYFGLGFAPPWALAMAAWDDSSSAKLQVTPRKTEVYVDGSLAGVVDDFDGFGQSLRLPAGDHELELHLEGHRSLRERVHFSPGETYKIKHVMTPLAAGEPAPRRPEPAEAPRVAVAAHAPAAPPERPRRRGADHSEFGTLTVDVRPADAAVWIDGERWDVAEGETRLVVQLAEGRHRLEVRREGYAPFSTSVEVRRGETATINVSLPSLERR